VNFNDVLWGELWTNWRTNPPPRKTIVLARWDENRTETPWRVRTCTHGCCVFGSIEGHALKLPRWWAKTDDQEGPLGPVQP
jgi:hypothetical protein